MENEITSMTDEQLLRYSRHILLPQVGYEGQARLLRSTALVVGMGGLGSPAAIYLAGAGVGHLIIADADRVDLSNLQRQIAHSASDIGQPKVESARRTLLALNPDIRVTPLSLRVDEASLMPYLDQVDVVIDASDNFATRFAVNAACVRARKPLVSGAAIRLEGQVAVFHAEREGSPCYRCLYGAEEELAETCSQTGVLAPLVGVIGSIQALEALKVLLGIGETLGGRLLVLDALRMEWRSLRLRKDPRCPVCG
jgi:molybdopterin-synthase adenylyltransferase